MKKQGSTDFLAENRLILRGKWSMMIATADKYGCRTLPMRNWHISNFLHQRSRLPETLKKVGHYLWGIDTTTEYLLSFIIIVGHYLWGIDTPVTWATNRTSPCRTLPMRNWHLHIVPRNSSLSMMSDITYEELTHAFPKKILLDIESPFVGHYLWGIDTLGFDTIVLFHQKSRTLPMRNWHQL